MAWFPSFLSIADDGGDVLFLRFLPGIFCNIASLLHSTLLSWPPILQAHLNNKSINGANVYDRLKRNPDKMWVSVNLANDKNLCQSDRRMPKHAHDVVRGPPRRVVCLLGRLTASWLSLFPLPVIEQRHSLAQMSIRKERGRKKTYPLGSISPSSPRSAAAAEAAFPPPSPLPPSFPVVFTVRSLPRIFSHTDASSAACVSISWSSRAVPFH